MKLRTETATDCRLARAWYLKYPLDAYALGPARFAQPVSAAAASDDALSQFGERPAELWPDGPVEETEPYEYLIDIPM